MRKILSLLLYGLGGFLLVTALLLMVWAPGQVKRTPLDTNSTTRLVGEATYQNTPRTRVEALSRNKVDTKRSTDDAVVFNVFTCLVKDADNTIENCVAQPDPRLITSSEDVFAADRRTAQALPNYKNLPQGAIPHRGLVNKFPFDVEKKTYQFWDGVLGRSVPATFQGEETLQGLKTYKFLVSVKDAPATISTLDDGTKVQGTYSTEKMMWVDPVTGAIQKQTEQQNRKLENGSNAIDLDFQFTDATVAANVKDAKDNGKRLNLVSKAPWFLLPLGLLALLGGFLLSRRGRDETDDYDDDVDGDDGDDRRRAVGRDDRDVDYDRDGDRDYDADPDGDGDTEPLFRRDRTE
ncbi:DUF3068 domain-containing protein [Barrientosiimonas humi]|uniref:DUF3068 domain-containing protein n=1 Tax=Barrientosiimonas humi TaxID=999931 RepID=UPI00370DAFB6